MFHFPPMIKFANSELIFAIRDPALHRIHEEIQKLIQYKIGGNFYIYPSRRGSKGVNNLFQTLLSFFMTSSRNKKVHEMEGKSLH